MRRLWIGANLVGEARLDTRYALVPILLALSGLAGCIGPAAEPEVGRLDVRRLPGESVQTDLLVDWAETLLAGRCMASGGYKFIVDWPYDDLPLPVGPFGSDDVETARTVGFGLRAGRASITEDPNQALVAGLSLARQAQYTAAMFGADTDQAKVTLPDGSVVSTGLSGCLADARRALFGQDLDGWFRLDVWASNAQEEILSQVLGSAEYGKALDVWRTCITDNGYATGDPVAARDLVAQAHGQLSADVAWQLERKIAVAAATCARQSSLVSIGQRLQTQITATVLARSPANAAEHERRRTTAIDKARQLRAELAFSAQPTEHKEGK